MRRQRKLIILTIASIAIVGIISAQLFRPSQHARAAEAAAYTNLLALAKSLAGDSGDTEAKDLLFLSQNEASLIAAERALSMPIDLPEAEYTSSEGPAVNYAAFKRLARAFMLKGSQAEKHGENAKAADQYANVLLLGIRIENGPVIASLVGAAIQHLALRRLKAILPKLSTQDLCRIAQRIQKMNRERISFIEISRREDYYAATRARANNLVAIIKWRFSAGRKQLMQKTEARHLDLQTQLEGISGAAAALAFFRENKIPPANIQSLVPKYLNLLPTDPNTGSPMHIGSFANGAVVYSVGPNKTDESGRGDDVSFLFED